MDVIIRNATEKDYSQVEKLMEQVHAIHVELRPDVYRNNLPIMEKMEFEEGLKKNSIFVAEYGKKVIGFLSILYREIEGEHIVSRKVLFVEAMAVDEMYRGQGIGHCFFDFLKKRKLEMGYDAIELQVNAKNSQALKMYVDYGFTYKSINMELIED